MSDNYYSYESYASIINNSYQSFGNQVNTGQNIFETFPSQISMSADMYSNESYFDATIRLLFAWAKDVRGNVSQPKDASSTLNSSYAVSGDNILQ